MDLFRTVRVPLFERAEEIARSFSASGRALFYTLAGCIIASSLGLLFILNGSLQTEVAAYGGSYTEGIIGSPRFINPVLALSDADHDMTALVYSGLLKAAPDGTFTPDLAQEYQISPDGKTYTVRIRETARFQDGEPVTADDVAFTVGRALDPALKSPMLANWMGIVTNVIDPHTVEFTLSQPYAPFIENLTMGILPKHLWQNVSADEFPFSELNTKPIGSGPYKVSSVSRTSSGIPSSYDLTAFDAYALGKPYISRFTLRFYQSEDALVAALKGGGVEAASGISPASLTSLKGFSIHAVPLSRVFGVFFNQNQNEVLRNLTVRKALSDAVDRDALVATVLGSYGVPLAGPIPPSISRVGTVATGGTFNAASGVGAADEQTKRALAARDKLLQAGWKVGPDGILTLTTGKGKTAKTLTLSFTLSTSNVPELRAVASYLEQVWGKMGAKVAVQVYDQGDLSENVIRPRKYDALLFGEVVGRGLDLFAFWDSKERSDPGLNIALYANANVDSFLEQLRQANSDDARQSLYKKIQAQIESDMPAVFLYSPDFVYVVPKDVRGMALGAIGNPSNRFDTAQEWYRQTDHVWEIFAK